MFKSRFSSARRLSKEKNAEVEREKEGEEVKRTEGLAIGLSPRSAGEDSSPACKISALGPETKREERRCLQEEGRARTGFPLRVSRRTTEKNFIFERRTKSARMFFGHFLDLTSNATDCSQRRPVEFRHFQRTVEHSLKINEKQFLFLHKNRRSTHFDEGRFLVDFVRRSDQFQFLDDFR